jgi:membrane protein
MPRTTNHERRGHRPGQAAVLGANPVAALLVGVGLAWMALTHRRERSRAQTTLTAQQQADADAAAPGGTADRPTAIPSRGWREVLLRVKDEVTKDNMSIVAAGCAFYALLGLFPAITALVSLYGLVADPVQIESQLSALQGVIPQEAFGIVRDQAHAVASKGATTLGWSAVLAILLALYSASAGVKSLFTALDIAYEEQEDRGFLSYNAWVLGFTLAAVLAVAIGLGVIVGVPALLRYLPLGPLANWAVKIASWAILFVLAAAGIGLTYRFGPSRAPAGWRWITPGSIAATVLWFAASLAFSYYAANFGSYDKTYGTLGGVIILLMWLWLTAYVVLLGAELNAELELQTARDTTTGPELPRGQRQAFAADHTAREIAGTRGR